jgi:hypothetical protein
MNYIEILKEIDKNLSSEIERTKELPTFIRWKVQGNIKSALVHVKREINRSEEK